MKKIILTVCILMMAFIQSNAFADEILDSTGNITPCTITNVSDGYIVYRKNGSTYSFQREKDSPIFNDYVDVRTKLFKKDSVIRYTGKVLIKDLENVRLRNEIGDMDIPWYRVKFVGIYKP